ncbi:unnamed protein product [Prunus armeniaca]
MVGEPAVYCTCARKYLKVLGTGKLANHLCGQIGQVARNSLTDTCVLSTGTRKHLKPTANGKLANNLCSHNRQVAWEVMGNWPKTCAVKSGRYTQICKVDWERGKWPTTCEIIPGRQLGTEKLAHHLHSQIGQVAGEIIVGHLCTNYKYTQTSKAEWERGNWPTTCVVISGRTTKYLKATGNGETGQSPVQSNSAGSRQVGTGKLANHLCIQIVQVAGEIMHGELAVYCTCTRKFLKATGNWETSRPLVQSNRAGGWEIIVRYLRTKYR